MSGINTTSDDHSVSSGELIKLLQKLRKQVKNYEIKINDLTLQNQQQNEMMLELTKKIQKEEESRIRDGQELYRCGKCNSQEKDRAESSYRSDINNNNVNNDQNLIDQLASQSQNINNLEIKLSESIKSNIESSSIIADLEFQIKNYIVSNKTQTELIIKLEDNMLSYDNKLIRLNSSIDNLNNVIIEKSNKIIELETLLQESNLRFNNLREKYKDLNRNLLNEEEVKKNKINEIILLKEKLVCIQLENTELSNELESRKSIIEQLNTSLVDMNNKFNENQITNAELINKVEQDAYEKYELLLFELKKIRKERELEIKKIETPPSEIIESTVVISPIVEVPLPIEEDKKDEDIKEEIISKGKNPKLNLDYLKNIFIKFVLLDPNERNTLLPVLSTLLKFNARDRAIINRNYWTTGRAVPFPKDKLISTN